MSGTEEKNKLREWLPRLDDKSLNIFIENTILEKEDLLNLENEDIVDLKLSIGQRAYVKRELARLQGETTTENSNAEAGTSVSGRSGQTTDPPEASAAVTSSKSKSVVSRKTYRPNMDWSEEKRANLREEIENFTPVKEAGISHVNIILVGQQGTGKSSLFNTLDSSINNRIKQRAEARDESKSVTLKILQHRLRGRDGDKLKINISDTIGIGRGGQVDESMKSTLQQGVLPGMQSSRENRMHCGVFVLPANSMDFPAKDVLDILIQFQTAFVANDIKYIVALTKIDALADEHTDIREIYHSEDMDNRVKEIAKFFRITKNRVWPMKNYTDEVDGCDLYIDILALSILQKMISDANCTLEVDVDNESMERGRAEVIKQEIEKKEREQEAIRQAEHQRAEIEQMKRAKEAEIERIKQQAYDAEQRASQLQRRELEQIKNQAHEAEIQQMRRRVSEAEEKASESSCILM